ncbi:MAG: hypothetical protein AVDCRST_MAG08-4342, partial [uncultured Acetobacteraceae bacterium]
QAHGPAERRRGRPARPAAEHGGPGRGRGADQPARGAGDVPHGQPGRGGRAAAALRARVHGRPAPGQRHGGPRGAPHRRRDAAPARGEEVPERGGV